MLITTNVVMKITPRNITYYKNKGYVIPEIYSTKSKKIVPNYNVDIIVSIFDLPKSSHKKVKYKCDNCGAIKEIAFSDFNRLTNKQYGIFCKSCSTKIKLPKIMLDKYGVNNCSNLPFVSEKRERTCLEKYGSKWSIGSSYVKNKIKAVFVEKYGVENPILDEQIKEKRNKTNIEKYGGISPFNNKTVRDKVKKTNIERYGIDNPYKLKSTQEKAKQTLYKNGNCPSSKAEKQMCQILMTMYGKENCFPSFQEGNLLLDCLVFIDNYRIDFEYDGIYWYKNRENKDRARNAVLMSLGYKVVRIKGNNKDELPDQLIINKAVQYLILENHNLIYIGMNKKNI